MGGKEGRKGGGSSVPSLSAPEENASFVSGCCFNPVQMGKAHQSAHGIPNLHRQVFTCNSGAPLFYHAIAFLSLFGYFNKYRYIATIFKGYSGTFLPLVANQRNANQSSLKIFFLIKNKVFYNDLNVVILRCFLSHFLFSIFASSRLLLCMGRQQ